MAVEVAVWFGTPGPVAEEGASGSEPRASEGEEKKTTETRESESPARPSSRSDADRIAREPDRVRLIVAPDGPVSSWKELR